MTYFDLKFDIFLSYHEKYRKQVERFYQTLTETYNLNVWFDLKELVDCVNPYEKSRDGILKSKLFLVCLSKEYARDENCLIEFDLAMKTFKKPIFLVFFQRFDLNDASQISNRLADTGQFDTYNAPLYDKGLWLRAHMINKLRILLQKPVLSRNDLSVIGYKKSMAEERADELKLGIIPQVRLSNSINKILHYSNNHQKTFKTKIF